MLCPVRQYVAEDRDIFFGRLCDTKCFSIAFTWLFRLANSLEKLGRWRRCWPLSQNEVIFAKLKKSSKSYKITQEQKDKIVWSNLTSCWRKWTSDEVKGNLFLSSCSLKVHLSKHRLLKDLQLFAYTCKCCYHLRLEVAEFAFLLDTRVNVSKLLQRRRDTPSGSFNLQIDTGSLTPSQRVHSGDLTSPPKNKNLTCRSLSPQGRLKRADQFMDLRRRGNCLLWATDGLFSCHV